MFQSVLVSTQSDVIQEEKEFNSLNLLENVFSCDCVMRIHHLPARAECEVRISSRAIELCGTNLNWVWYNCIVGVVVVKSPEGFLRVVE